MFKKLLLLAVLAGVLTPLSGCGFRRCCHRSSGSNYLPPPPPPTTAGYYY